ncbi:MAG: hypothetical protein P8J14_10500 [Emcibacteraceae bacterium]|nr:hypothetical protein [Emcibacteraceae bacterium]
MKKAQLQDIKWPEFGLSERPADITLVEYQERLIKVRTAMKSQGYSHLLIYGDREHFANLAWLTNIDPRFEEAMLIIGSDEKPLILVGNECEGYLPHSPLFQSGDMRGELYQPFSLLDQARDKSRTLNDIFLDEGINKNSNIGCVGWKYLSENEDPLGKQAIDIPSFITDNARKIVGFENVENATDLFMHPGYGFRTVVSVDEIAIFEHSNVKASEAVKRIIFGLEDGIIDHDAAKLMQWDGDPLGCHPTFASGTLPGLCGPQGRAINKGEPLSFNICYWGSNICRAGWMANDEGDLPEDARDYIDEFAGPYFVAMANWFSNMSIGTMGSVLLYVVE